MDCIAYRPLNGRSLSLSPRTTKTVLEQNYDSSGLDCPVFESSSSSFWCYGYELHREGELWFAGLPSGALDRPNQSKFFLRRESQISNGFLEPVKMPEWPCKPLGQVQPWQFSQLRPAGIWTRSPSIYHENPRIGHLAMNMSPHIGYSRGP